jgi:alpha-tubulin suppressor-like RCC1 family protein
METCTEGPCATVPQAVVGGLNFTVISAGSDHTCGLTADDVGYCWGTNGGGLLGVGTSEEHRTPAPIAGGLALQSISAGDGHTCAVADGNAYCWGWNVYGRLGNGTLTDSNIPVRIRGS